VGSPPGTDETGARKEGTDMTGTQADVAIGTLRHCFETAQEMVREALDKRPDATTNILIYDSGLIVTTAVVADVALMRVIDPVEGRAASVLKDGNVLPYSEGLELLSPIALWVETIEAAEAQL